MEVDSKLKIKTEPVDQPYVETEAKIHQQQQNGSDGEEVAQEYSVVLLRPRQNVSTVRLMFEGQELRKMESCTGQTKCRVKHLQLTYETPRTHTGTPVNELAALYDGDYNGEDLSRNEALLRHAVAFFKSNRFYIVPINESYEMYRKINRSKKEPVDTVDQSKIDDAKLAQIDASPSVNPVRVSFARSETEWQKKRREQSAQHKQQLIDNDPWIELTISKSGVKQVFDEQIKRSENCKPAIINTEHILPVL